MFHRQSFHFGHTVSYEYANTGFDDCNTGWVGVSHSHPSLSMHAKFKYAKSFCSDGVGDPARRFGSVLPHWSLQLLAIHVAGALWGADQRDPGNPPRQEHCHAVRILGLSVDLSYQLGGCHGLGQVDHVGVGPRTMRQADARLPRKVLARCCPVCSSRSRRAPCVQHLAAFCSLSTRKTTHSSVWLLRAAGLRPSRSSIATRSRHRCTGPSTFGRRTIQ